MASNRERIKEKASELLQRDGILATSIRDIARKCGISTGTLTYHFPSREDLLLELLLDHVHRRDLALFEILALEDREERRKQLETFFLDESNRFWQRLHFHLVGISLSGNDKLLERMVISTRAWEDELAELPILENLSSDEERLAEASLINATLNGLSISNAMGIYREDPKEVLTRFLTRFDLL